MIEPDINISTIICDSDTLYYESKYYSQLAHLLISHLNKQMKTIFPREQNKSQGKKLLTFLWAVATFSLHVLLFGTL